MSLIEQIDVDVVMSWVFGSALGAAILLAAAMAISEMKNAAHHPEDWE